MHLVARRLALVLLCGLIAAPLMAAPDWPRLPTDAAMSAVVRAYCAKYTGRQDAVAMPGSPPDGSYNQTTLEPVRLMKFHNPRIPDPVASGEAFAVVHRVSEDVSPGRSSRREDYALLRIVHQERAGLTVIHVSGWAQLPGDAQLAAFIASFLNGTYAQTLYEGYSRDDVWLPGFAGGGRKISITAYDGSSDTTHMPFTFHVAVTDADKPAAGAEIAIRFIGEARALGDRFATWNADQGRWLETNGVNLALDTALPVKLDARGQAIVRGFLDFGRLRLHSLSLPVESGIEVGAEGAEPVRSTVQLRHPAFVRNVYFWCANDPQWPGAPRWIRLSYLDGPACRPYLERTDAQTVAGVRLPHNRYGAGDACYPTPFEIPKRVLINRVPFSPPDWERDYFVPLDEGDELILDLAAPGKFASSGFTPMPGDGLMVEVLWLDGVTALFAQRRESEDLLAVRLPRSGAALPGSAEQAWIRYFADETGEWLVTDRLIEAVVVGGATLAGGPVAGAWAAVICEAGLVIKDAKELHDVGSGRHKVVLIRSRVALTHDAGGALVLHTFEGQPGVLSGRREFRARAGESIAFTLAGTPDVAVRASPPPGAAAMVAALPTREAVAGSPPAPPRAAAGAARPPAAAVGKPPVEPPQPSTREQQLAAAQRELDEAFKAYTKLATTGGEGDIEAAHARYKAAYERLQELKER